MKISITYYFSVLILEIMCISAQCGSEIFVSCQYTKILVYSIKMEHAAA